MLTNSLRALALGSALVVAGGSATVIKGTSQPVTIATNPPGAQVYIDNQPMGVAPLTVNVKHGDHTVAAQMAGYAPGYARLTASFSGWTLLNVFGFFGIIVDALTGAITTLDQNTVVIQLAPGQGGQQQPIQVGPQQPGGSAIRH